MNTRLMKYWFLIAGLATLIAVPFLLRADSQQRQSIAANYQQIESMTKLEREGLERNYERWDDLTSTQKLRYRTLHQQLEQDAAESKGNLKEIKDVYVGWLRTLRADQRSQLRVTHDAQEKMELIREYVAEQRERQIAREYGEPEQNDPNDSRMRMSVNLTTDDVDAMMEVFEQYVSRTFSLEQRRALDELDGVSRHLKLLEIEMERKGGDNQRVFTPGLVNAMIDSIDKEPSREKLREPPPPDSPFKVSSEAFTMFKFTYSLSNALWREWRELSRQVMENADQNLEEQFNSRSPAEQDELLGLPPDQFKERLRNVYVHDALGINPWHVFGRLRGFRRSGGGPRRGGRDGGGRPGPPGPPGGRGDGERPRGPRQ